MVMDTSIPALTCASSVPNHQKLKMRRKADLGFECSRIRGGRLVICFPKSRAWSSKLAKIGVAKAVLASEVIEKSILTSKDDMESRVFQSAMPNYQKADPKKVASIILGGGAGTRLFPLTSTRAMPAVTIGGCFRLIDIPMSNCINSEINKIYIMTQFNSASLNRHIYRTYNFGMGITFGGGFVEVLAATQTPGEAGMNWFQGTADAVRQFIWVFEDVKNKNIEHVLILSGNHLYRMNYMDFVQKHVDTGADITVSCVPMDESRASNFDLIKVDETGRIIQFSEKPTGANLEALRADTWLLGLTPQEARRSPYIASMGVYVFRKEDLLKLLRWRYPNSNDFGSEIIPNAVKEHNVQAYLFNDYWEDIGTIKSFFDTNLALTGQDPKFEFHDPTAPFYTSPRYLPPIKVEKSQDTLMMGADDYQTEAEIASLLSDGKVPIGVGHCTKIRNCIIDMNARIGRNVVIANKDGVEEADRPSEGFCIRSGIAIVLKNATIKDGTVI